MAKGIFLNYTIPIFPNYEYAKSKRKIMVLFSISQDYINAGMLLLNIKKIKRNDITLENE